MGLLRKPVLRQPGKGRVVAIYSLHHSHVGRSTQAQPGTAGAHVRYITRSGAARLVMGENMPTGRDQARDWMNEREATDRKNGRVIDKLMVALPLELDGQQRADLVREFVAEIGGGRVAWVAAIHDRGEDACNPHAHIAWRDKDLETGRRVFGTSEKGSTERLREIWEAVANRVLEREGEAARIDRRSLVDQALAREPGIHVGPNVRAMEERGLRPVSIAQELETGRVVNWPEIDQGRTRADRQREIEAMNRDREAERGKEKGRQEAEHVPAMSEPAREIETPARVLNAAEATPEPEREPQAAWPVLGGTWMAWHQPEAIQRASYEVDIGDRGRDRQEIEPGRPERSRLVQIVETARERLAGLAERLEQAFQAIRHRQQEPQRERTPGPAAAAERDPWEALAEIGRKKREAEAQPEQQRERDEWERSLWPDYSKGRERKGPGF